MEDGAPEEDGRQRKDMKRRGVPHPRAELSTSGVLVRP